MKLLVTGSAGFIGFHVSQALLARGDEVVGVDNMNAYYDVNLKRERLLRLARSGGYTHEEIDISDRDALESVFERHKPDRVVNLAAQAGVRYASQNPHVYASSNIVGFLNVLEGCRGHDIEHLVFASSSSVYGANTAMPYSEHQSTAHPLTLYGATKKANEQMAHSYSHMFNLPCTGLRFFTVYGPWGRPDMALFLFAKAILNDEPVRVFNHGRHRRSFTYVGDVVEGVVRAIDRIPLPDHPKWKASCPDPARSSSPFRIYNVGSGESTELLEYIRTLEKHLGRKAKLELLPLQLGDVPDTEADTEEFHAAMGYRPHVSIDEGVARFVDWYRNYYAGST